jgi:N-acetylglucosaminyldiphosphoundecaprenol N-acetyl-beta-D-mannosaminyltransferase
MRLRIASKFKFPHPLARDISFVNFFSLYEVLKDRDRSQGFVFYSDGLLLCAFVRLLCRKAVDRVSFDFSSVADEVFTHCEQQQRKVFFVGARPQEHQAFLEKIASMYPALNIVGSSHGHMPKADWPSLFQAMIATKTDLLIVGMGGGLQEQFIRAARLHGVQGEACTCGGFFTQTAVSGQGRYYPALINKLHLRSLYRMYREPHTVRRYLIDYPRNIFRFIKDTRNRALTIDVI